MSQRFYLVCFNANSQMVFFVLFLFQIISKIGSIAIRLRYFLFCFDFKNLQFQFCMCMSQYIKIDEDLEKKGDEGK